MHFYSLPSNTGIKEKSDESYLATLKNNSIESYVEREIT